MPPTAPSRPIARGLPGPALLAHVMVAKYCDHTPLYRQSRIYARGGVDIDRSTMVGWVEQGNALVAPLAAVLGRHALGGPKVHADDTPVPVLDPGRGRTKTGRLWVYVRDDRPCGSRDAPAVWFQYSPDRGGEHPREHLKRYHGILQADAYSGYEKLYDSGRVVHAACMAHARRYYWDVYEAHKRAPGSVAEQALKRIAKLYEIEADIRGQPPDERRRERQERAAPLLKDLHVWLSKTLAQVSAKSDLAQAIGYTLAHWRALTRYCDDGRIEIDNNAAERALRGVGLGRKNLLFFGSDAGGERSAAMYSLVESAKLNGLDPTASPIIRSTASRSCCRGTSAGSAKNRNDRQRRHGDQGAADQGSAEDPAIAHRIARHQAQGVASRARAADDHVGAAASGDPGRLRLGARASARVHRRRGRTLRRARSRLRRSRFRQQREHPATTALRRSTLRYVYDFGDNWDHRIQVEKTLPADPLLALAFCVGGACATPPEDCGGMTGYAEFLRTMADPADPGHARLAEWIGADSWDPKAFDSIAANDRLAQIKL